MSNQISYEYNIQAEQLPPHEASERSSAGISSALSPKENPRNAEHHWYGPWGSEIEAVLASIPDATVTSQPQAMLSISSAMLREAAQAVQRYNDMVQQNADQEVSMGEGERAQDLQSGMDDTRAVEDVRTLISKSKADPGWAYSVAFCTY